MKTSVYKLLTLITLLVLSQRAEAVDCDTVKCKGNHPHRHFNFEMPELPPMPDLSMLDEQIEYMMRPHLENIAEEFDIEEEIFGSREEEKKSLNKTFRLNDNTIISLDNRYGNINLETWERKEAEIIVEITASASKMEKARELLDMITVNFTEDKANNSVTAKTDFSAMKGRSIGTSSFKINFFVKIPSGNPLQVINKFGDVIMQDYSGITNIKVSYGKLWAGNLSSKEADIYVSFGNAEIKSLNQSKLVLKYSGLKLSKVNSLNLKNEFSNLQIGDAGTVNMESRYGDVKFQTVDVLNGSSNFSGLIIQKLNKSIELDMQYSPDFRIKELGESFEKVDVDLSFGDMVLYVPRNTSFDFDVNLSFGSLKTSGNAVFKEVSDRHSKSYSGHYNDINERSKITVNGSYSSVKFYERE